MEKKENESIKVEKVRKIFLDDLPRYECGLHKGKINWKESIGYKVRFVYYDIEGEFEIIDYEVKKHLLHLKYKDNDIVKIFTGHLQDCKLGNLVGRKTGCFKQQVGDVFKDDKRDIVITDIKYIEKEKKSGYIEKQKWYKYTCNKCGWTEGWIEESPLLNQKNGCSCCNCKTPVLGINTIWDTDRWMIDLGVSEKDAKRYTRGSGDKIKVKCPNCENQKEINIGTIYRNKSIGCPKCGDGQSYPNKICFSLLKQLNIEFESEYSPKWCEYYIKNKLKHGRYDFYFELNNKKYILEMDGGWHSKDNNMSGQTKEESREMDDYKDILAEEHEIKVIRIECNESKLEYIKERILNSELHDLFDLSKIDWLKIEKFAMSNRVREVCELKKNNPDMTTTEICETMKLSGTAVLKYLKKGTKLGWCKYDPKEETRKSSMRIGKLNGKPIEVFKDGVSLGIFESAAELERQSKELFGVKLNQGATSSVCLGKTSHNKGYQFKYV